MNKEDIKKYNAENPEVGYVTMAYGNGFGHRPTSVSAAHDTLGRAKRDFRFGANYALIAKISYVLPFDQSDVPAFPAEIAAIKTLALDNSGWVPWSARKVAWVLPLRRL